MREDVGYCQTPLYVLLSLEVYGRVATPIDLTGINNYDYEGEADKYN